MSPLRRFAAGLSALPLDSWAALFVLGLALLARLAFSFRAPPFVTNDSVSYLLPGFDLAHGLGFSPILKRPPLYPAFIGSVIALFGEELRVLVLVQHLLGVLVALATFALGRLVFGTAVGLLAGVLTALSGPLLVMEHYLMSETLFAALQLGAIMAYLVGARSRQLGLFVAAGLLLGLAALTRPIAQLTLVILLAGLPLLMPSWRPALRAGATMLAVFAVAVLPWMVRNALVQGTFAIAGGSGEGLAVRTIRYDQQFDFREPSGGDPDRQTARARRIYREEASEGSAFELAGRLRDELGVSEIQAERLMREIALEAILRQPGYYLQGTADMIVKTFAGRPVRLRQDWTPWRNIAWAPRVEHLLPAPTPAEERAFPQADALATLYDPAPWWGLLVVLALVGTVARLARARCPALLLGTLVVAQLVACAALIGIEYRYRYPLDPLINVLAAGGLAVAAAALGRAVVPRAARRRAG